MIKKIRKVLKALQAASNDVLYAVVQSLITRNLVRQAGEDREKGGEAYMGAAAVWALQAIKHVNAPNYYTGDFEDSDGRRFSLHVEWAKGRTVLDDLADARRELRAVEQTAREAESEANQLYKEARALECELDELNCSLDEKTREADELYRDVQYLRSRVEESQGGQY